MRNRIVIATLLAPWLLACGDSVEDSGTEGATSTATATTGGGGEGGTSSSGGGMGGAGGGGGGGGGGAGAGGGAGGSGGYNGCGPCPGPRAFVTRGLHQGGLIGGVAGANLLCQTAANTANLCGTWRAWLSDSNTPAGANVTGAFTWHRMDCAPIADKAGLLAGTLQSPIDYDEMSMPLGSADPIVWTGSEAGLPIQHCIDWTMSNSAGTLGRATDTDAAWESTGTSACVAYHRVYCFEHP